MNIERKSKFKRKRDIERFILPFDLSSLELFCAYTVSDNPLIRKNHLIKMKSLFDCIDIDSFQNDMEKIKRVDFINKALEARVIENIQSIPMVLKYVNGDFDNSIIDTKNLSEINLDEFNWVNKTISTCLKSSHITTYLDKMYELYETYRATDYKDRLPIVMNFEVLVKEMQARFRQSRIDLEENAYVSLEQVNYEETIRHIHQKLSSPSNKLATGMIGMNEMLDGGFEEGRVYIVFGLPGEGKSLTLLDLAFQLKMYNKNYILKNRACRPCIVILTMENDKDETTSRLFNMVGHPGNLVQFSPEDILDISKRCGLCVDMTNPIDIVIKYKPSNSEDTSYLYTLVEDLEDEGLECICLIQDYIKRIRPSESFSNDVRLELGRVVDDFKNFAIAKRIPVITASQLNRDATKHIDEGRKVNKADLLRLLGRNNIGESMLILENVDAAFIIAPEFEIQSKMKYLGVQRIKCRYKASKRDHIYQPYKFDNQIKLIEDIMSPQPVYRDSLRNDIDQLSVKTNKVNYHTNIQSNSYENIKLLTTSEDGNLYKTNAVVFKQDDFE